jgi:hypothetical protein
VGKSDWIVQEVPGFIRPAVLDAFVHSLQNSNSRWTCHRVQPGNPTH